MSNLKTLILRKSHSKKQHKITGLYIFKNTKVDKVMHKGEGGGGLQILRVVECESPGSLNNLVFLMKIKSKVYFFCNSLGNYPPYANVNGISNNLVPNYRQYVC